MERFEKFPLGQAYISPRALTRLVEGDILTALARHESGDWGDLPDEEGLKDEIALIVGQRLISAYHAVNGTLFLIVTEADRSETLILLPEEYPL